MDANDLLSQDTPTVVVEGVVTLLTLVGVGLKLAGKNVPVIDQILKVLQVVARVLPKKKELPPSDPAKEPGLLNVIDLQDVKKAESKKDSP